MLLSTNLPADSVGSMILMGKDRMGWMYLGMTDRVVLEYTGSILTARGGHDSEKENPELQRGINNCLWGAFNSTTSESHLKHRINCSG